MFGDLQENIQRAMEKMGQMIKTETTREITREITREMTSLMNGMKKASDIRFDGLDQGMSNVSNRLECIERDSWRMTKRVESVEGEMNSLKTRFSAMQDRLKDVEEGGITLSPEEQVVKLDKATAAKKGARTLGLKGVKWFEGEDGDRKTIKERV